MIRLRGKDFQLWVYNHRLFLWVVIFLSSLATILILTGEELWISPELLENIMLPLQYKLLNSTPLIFLARIILIAVGVVIMMICLLFPLFRLGKEGIQWTAEMEEELARYSGEIAGEEVEELVREESRRWSLIHRWILLESGKDLIEVEYLRELLATIWEAFPLHRISLTVAERDQPRIAALHPLLPGLIQEDQVSKGEEGIGFGINFPEGKQLLLIVYARQAEGFSSIDRIFLVVLGEIFSKETSDRQKKLSELLRPFEKVTLTPTLFGV